MLKKSSRRVFGFVVAALIALTAAAQPVPAAAPTNGTLYGAVGCLFCSQSIDQLDPAAGTETPIAALEGLSVTALVADSASQLLYVAASYGGGGRGGGPGINKMITFDSQTGLATVSPILSVGALDMALDPATHTLFVLATTFDGQTLHAAIDRLDPATWAATPLATLPFGARGLAYDPSSRILYTQTGDFNSSPPTGQLIAINTQTGAVSRTSLNPPVANLVFDTSAQALYGETGSFPSHVVQVNPSTGAETQIGSFAFPQGFANAVAIDSGTHTVFFVEAEIVAGGERATWIANVNDQTGASTVSPQTAQTVWEIAFQSPPITPESIQSDVRNGLASVAIDNAGVAHSLLAKLSGAADARSRGQCGTAAHKYDSFIHELSAQSGKHVAEATAAQLTAEAQFLIANCP